MNSSHGCAPKQGGKAKTAARRTSRNKLTPPLKWGGGKPIRPSTDDYAFEMSEADHVRMLDTIEQCSGKVMLSGCPNALYNRELHGWNREELLIDNKAAGGKTKKTMTEVLWMNF